MTVPSAKWLLQILAYISLLIVNTTATLDGKANLEDYMRYTPPPVEGVNETMAPTTAEPSFEPTGSPTTKPTFAPSEAPTTAAPTEAPTVAASEVPTEAVSGVPTSSPTNPPTTLSPTDSPTEAATTATPTTPPSLAPTSPSPTEAPVSASPSGQPSAQPTTPPRKENLELTAAETTDTTETDAPTPSPTISIVVAAAETDGRESGDLFSETMEYQNSVGEIFVEFSIFSPNVTNLEINFMKLKMGVCKSIDPLVCDENHAIREDGPEYCAVRDEVLLRDGVAESRREPIVLTDYDVTVMALAATNVMDTEDVIHGQEVAWTTWRMSYNVLQLGPALRKHINQTAELEGTTTPLTEAQVNAKGLGMVQKMMEVNMERTLNSGKLQQDLNDFMKDLMLVVSVVGEEIPTYEPFVQPVATAVHQGEELEAGEDGEGGGLMVVFFFAGLGVACFVIVTLLYFSFRSRRSVVRRKRTIVILDDTSKSCTDSQNSSSQEEQEKVVDTGAVLDEDAPRAKSTARASATRPQKQQQLKEDEEVAASTKQKQEPAETSNRQQKKQQYNEQQSPSRQQEWDDNTSADVSGSATGDGEETVQDADVESQWGRSMAQSSAYTGSISAITGVSGLEHSDTWSVGSMSIDLAEWG